MTPSPHRSISESLLCASAFECVTAPADPTRDGYTFVGWSNSSTGGSIWDFATPVTSELTLYAQWQPIVPVRDAQTITVTTDPGAPHPGDTYIPGASSTSNLPVAVTLGPDSAQVCHLSGTTVSFDAPGTCDIRYDQEGDASYTAAVVSERSAHLMGMTTDTTTGDPLEGTVRVLIDGDPLPEVATSHGVADVSLNGPVGDTLAAGTHQIEVSFTPSDANHDSAHSSSVLVIAQAQTTTGLIVTGTEVVAAVAAAAPAHGNPTGTVTFYLEQRNIGTAQRVRSLHRIDELGAVLGLHRATRPDDHRAHDLGAAEVRFGLVPHPGHRPVHLHQPRCRAERPLPEPGRAVAQRWRAERHADRARPRRRSPPRPCADGTPRRRPTPTAPWPSTEPGTGPCGPAATGS